MHKDHRLRSILKAITYRFVSIMLDTAIAYIVTRDASQTLTLVVVSNVFSIVMYFVHERVWERVSFGKRTVPHNPS